MKLLYKYINGTYKVRIYDTGTKLRLSDSGEFIPEFPESIDMTITEYCDGGCPYCYAGCSTLGEHCNFNKYLKLLESIHPGTELAINGNDLSHPQLIEFLTKMKSQQVIVNMTVNQIHFMRNITYLHRLCDMKLINGLGISINHGKITGELINQIKGFSNAVIHIVVGIIDKNDFEKLYDNDLKILLLGYKNIGRGTNYYYHNEPEVISNQLWLKEELLSNELFDRFNVVSFDNLALDQLETEKVIPEEEFNTLYMGDDAHYTFFINLVKDYYSENSLCESKHPIFSNDVTELFKSIQKFN